MLRFRNVKQVLVGVVWEVQKRSLEVWKWCTSEMSKIDWEVHLKYSTWNEVCQKFNPFKYSEVWLRCTDRLGVLRCTDRLGVFFRSKDLLCTSNIGVLVEVQKLARGVLKVQGPFLHLRRREVWLRCPDRLEVYLRSKDLPCTSNIGRCGWGAKIG